MQKNLFKKPSNLRVRIISAGVIGLIFIMTIFFVRPLFFALIVGIMVMMLSEWHDMTCSKSNYLYSGLVIIPVPIASILYISNIDHSGWLLFSFFAIIWSVDSVAMFVGKLVKGPKLAPVLSPKKTISGLLGGIAAASLLPLLLNLIPAYSTADAIIHHSTTCKIMLMSQFAFLGAVAQMSDLFISYFKRKFKIKDSGNIIPGHGGMLDRFDSIILTAPIVAFYLHGQIG